VSPLLEAPPLGRPVARRANGHALPPLPPTGGGDEDREPAPGRPRLDNVRLGMMFFLAAEVMFFAGLISAFLVLRAQAPDWPPFDQPRLPVGVTGANTAVLLASGWALQRARTALRRGSPAFARRLGWTALLGGAFLAVQGSEWARLVRFGLTTSSSLYGGTFYALVGAHALHVLAAVVVLLVVLRRALRGDYRGADAFEPVRMYWLFVVGVWPVLYGLVYLA
jgi:heme/copper-type cytochrome/quinol oxidase subunit 3